MCKEYGGLFCEVDALFKPKNVQRVNNNFDGDLIIRFTWEKGTKFDKNNYLFMHDETTHWRFYLKWYLDLLKLVQIHR